MTRRLAGLVTGYVLVLASMLIAAPAAAQDPIKNSAAPRIAVISFKDAVLQTPEGQKLMADLKQKYDPETVNLKAQSDELDRLKERLNNSQLSQAERDSLQTEITDKQASFTKLADQKQQEFNAEAGAGYQKAGEKFYPVAVQYAQQHGFNVLIEVGGSDSSTFYAAPSSDITKAAEDAYAGSQKPAPLNFATPSAIPTRIAVVDIQSAIKETSEFKSRFQVLQKKYDPIRDKFKAESEETERMRSRLSAGNLSDAERASLTNTLAKRDTDYQKESQAAQDEMQADMQTEFDAVGKKVYDSLSKFAPQNGYTLVIDKAIKPDEILWSANSATPESLVAHASEISSTITQFYESQSASSVTVAHASPPPPTDSQPDRGFGKTATPQSSTAASTVPIPHNYALIFATDDYAHWPHLTNPIPDADALSETLQSLYSFQVEELRNPTNEQILGKLTEYLHRPFQPQDQLMIFISGHGYFDDDLGQGFIVPSNAPLVQDDLGHTRLLAHDTIMRYVNRIPSKHVVLIIDACFAGTLDRKIADSGLRGDPSMDIYTHVSLPELIERKEPKRTRRWIASGGKDFVPDGKPGHHSPFMAALLVTLNQAADRKGYATLDDIQLGLHTVTPEPRWGDIQDENEAGADFILLTSTAAAQLSGSN
jgi:Skp family chaperone for outer membrane proteins